MHRLPRALRDNPYEQAEICVCGHLYGIHWVLQDGSYPCSVKFCECEDYEMDRGD